MSTVLVTSSLLVCGRIDVTLHLMHAFVSTALIETNNKIGLSLNVLLLVFWVKM